jgi:hypothetical protein
MFVLLSGGAMRRVQRIGSLEIDHDTPHQMLAWKLQRVSWFLMGATLMAALAGIFGSGFANTARAGSPGAALAIEYPRFARLLAPADLRVEAVCTGTMAGVWIARPYADRVRIESVVPEPESVTAAPGRLLYTFRCSGPRAKIVFFMKPESIGRLSAEIGTQEGPPLRLAQFVYP